MAHQLRHIPLYASDTVSFCDVCCRPHGSGLSGEEFAAGYEIVFPRSGVFVKHIGRDEVVADLNQVLFFRPREPYRVSHPVDGGDDCTSFTFSPKLLHEVAKGFNPAVADWPQRLLPRSHVPNTAETVMLHQQLRTRVRQARYDPLEIDERSAELLAGVMAEAYDPQVRRPSARSQVTSRVHRELSEATKAVLAARMAQRLPLADVARSVHSSPFHLSRVFRRTVGVTLHQYLNRLRMRAALQRLADGQRNLTLLALELGFSSHSHFSDSFRGEFHVSPREFRRTLRTPDLHEMSKKLEV